MTLSACCGVGMASKDCEPEQFTNQIWLAKMSYFESKKDIPSLPVTEVAVAVVSDTL